MKKYLLILIVLIFVSSCSKKFETLEESEEVKLKISKISILKENTYDASYIVGFNRNSKEFYLNLFNKPLNFFKIGIIDVNTGEIKKEFKLSRGSFQSPTDCYSPTYMQQLGDRFYLYDQHHKIMVFNKNLKYLSSSMLHKFHVFVDFFQFQKEIYFFLGKYVYHPNGKSIKFSYDVYQFLDIEKPKHIETLFKSTYKSQSYLNSREEKKYYFEGNLLPKAFGFEKDGKLFWSDVTQPRYFAYDLKEQKTTLIPLNYLNKKRFTEEDATIAGRYRNTYEEKSIQKKFGRKIKYLPYPGDIYYFGIYDVGKGKIGILGDINLETLEIRLDLFTTQHKYLESIIFPAGYGTFEKINYSHYCTEKTVIDIDSGIYIFSDKEEVDEQNIVRFIKFKK
jgi:hypothetical protein